MPVSRLRLFRKDGLNYALPNLAHPDTKLALYHTLRAKSLCEGGITEQDVYSVCREVLGLLPSKKWCIRLLDGYCEWATQVKIHDTLSEWSLYIKKPKQEKGDLFHAEAS